MSETTEQTTAPKKGLSGMVLADLKSMAAGLGLKGTSTLRKGELIAAIQAHQGQQRTTNGGGQDKAARTAPARDAEATLPLDLPERAPRRRATRAAGAA